METVDQNSAHAYDAFISYSRHDRAFATLLQKALEAYKSPKGLEVPRRHLRIFRDEQDFTGPEYHRSLEKHLQDSAKLVVICSPVARQSPFVNDEIRRFVKIRGAEHIIPVLLSGIPNNEAKPDQEGEMAFPEALCEALGLPLAADYRGFATNKDKVNKGTFEGAWYKALADLYGKSRSEIEQRERKRERIRRFKLRLAVITLVVIVFEFSDVVFFLHAKSVLWAVNKVLEENAEYKDQLGAFKKTEFYCTYFQPFYEGKVFYLSESKSWIYPGRRLRQSFVLSKQGNQESRWFLVEERMEALRSRQEYLRLLRETRKDEQLGFPVMLNSETGLEALFHSGESPVTVQWWVEGSIARVYATYRLGKYVGKPYENESYTTILINVYENGFVLGGAPVEHGVDIQGIYILVKDPQGDGAYQNRGSWIDSNKLPFTRQMFKRPCERGKGYEPGI